jgi:hypothetical protein
MAAKKIVATAARRPSRGTLGPLVVFITNPDPPAGPWTLSWYYISTWTLSWEKPHLKLILDFRKRQTKQIEEEVRRRISK